MWIAGVDWGEKNVGLAISSTALLCATPRPTLTADTQSELIKKLRDWLIVENIVQVVLGLPLNMNGSEGPQAAKVRTLPDLITQKWPKNRPKPEFVFWDERLSTAAVDRAMLAGDLSRAGRAKRVDSLAAVWILQGYLESQNTRAEDSE